MAPHRRFRGVLKESAVPIERLPEARFPEAYPVFSTFLERRFHFGFACMHRPGEHHKAIAWLDPGQTRIDYWIDGFSQWTPRQVRTDCAARRLPIHYRPDARLIIEADAP